MHWVSDKKPDLTQFGFVYIITNLKNKKSYIGCKQYFNYRNFRLEIISMKEIKIANVKITIYTNR